MGKNIGYTKEYDSNDSLEIDIQDPTDWTIFQYPEGASGDDDVASQLIDHWQLGIDENQNSHEPSSCDHLDLNVQTNEPSKSNP